MPKTRGRQSRRKRECLVVILREGDSSHAPSRRPAAGSTDTDAVELQQRQANLRMLKAARAALCRLLADVDAEVAQQSDAIKPTVMRSVLTRLPNEVLSEILVHSIRLISAHAVETATGMSRHRAAMAFSQVSRRLREVSLSTPRMWTTISNGVMQNPKMLAMVLSRSGRASLELDWLGGPDDIPTESFEMLVEHACRWESLSLSDGRDSHVAQALPSFINGTIALPCVRSIALYDCEGRGSFSGLLDRPLPALRHFAARNSIPGGHIASSLATLDLHLEGDASSAVLSKLYAILRETTQLRDLRLELDTCNNVGQNVDGGNAAASSVADEAVDEARLHLLQLQGLEVNMCCPSVLEVLGPLLASLRTPRLTRLHFDIDQGDADAYISDFDLRLWLDVLLHKSIGYYKNVRIFYLQVRRYPEDFTLDSIINLHRLEELTIDAPHVSLGHTPDLPHLRTLRLRGCLQVYDAEVAEVVKGLREKPGAAFQRLEVEGPSSLDLTALAARFPGSVV